MAFPLDIWLDEELKVMHVRHECPGAKIPSKYGYLRREIVRTLEQARQLDLEYRACEGCEKELARKSDPAVERSYRYRPNRGEKIA